MMSLQKPAMTRLVDNLEKRNLVKRTSFPADRRGYAIVITSKGKELVSKVEDQPLSVMAKILSRCTSQEKAAIEKGFNIFLDKISKTCSN
jgi:3-hydroxy-9,10-secoandrosta-1,3,5(10)-triene-9,17-dione monooxygenase reductase component